ncbi:hypothetical protein [Mesorhizobium sp. M7A.F.Ca.CA.002.12.1.1]|uniref:hypothetical protein n=1 Tax=Mesorhizobium sp. M7A.F.Ca.CA.002.12.1.1 TaxID=2496735 RepID=UPI000FCBA246|nr:hypothetical protein [Mesorhizobium sp. M7A.F.Ca.CA.002.12.1.1]RUX60168.1 hypothetical protein EN989_11165 [Mesorhizobium sp. M7A.F.Ca.CA.002.12.1.1]
MADYANSIFGYGAQTPYLMGQDSGVGAQNAVGSYLQSQPASGISGTGSTADLSSILGYGNGPMFPAAPGQNQSSGLFSGMGGMDALKLGLGGLQTIGSLWQAWEANKLAKQQFSMQKNVAQTNLTNQISSYNTALEDKINSRYVTEGKTGDQAAAYIASHKLADAKI